MPNINKLQEDVPFPNNKNVIIVYIILCIVLASIFYRFVIYEQEAYSFSSPKRSLTIDNSTEQFTFEFKPNVEFDKGMHYYCNVSDESNTIIEKDSKVMLFMGKHTYLPIRIKVSVGEDNSSRPSELEFSFTFHFPDEQELKIVNYKLNEEPNANGLYVRMDY